MNVFIKYLLPMKKLLISLIFIMSLILSGSIANSCFAQDDVKTENKEDNKKQDDKKKATPKVEAKVNKGNPNGIMKNWFFGIKGGATFFLSPLKENPFSWGAGATLGKQLNSKVAVRVDYLYGNLKSDGQFVKENPDGSFYSNYLYANVDFMEIALIMKMNMNDFLYSKSPKHLREIYVFGGGAYTMFRTKITDTDGNFVTGKGYSLTGDQEAMAAGMAVPLGIGVTYKLGKKDIVNLNAEFGYRFTQTKELDGGLTENVSHYTFSSLGLLFNLGRPGLTPQKITADAVREDLESGLDSKITKGVNDKVGAELNPIKEDLAKQSVAVASNQEQLDILQEEMEARTNAIKEQLNTAMGYSSDNENNTEGVVRNTIGGVGGIDMSSVYFAFNSTYITPAMQREIAVIAKVLKKNKKLRCEIVGNSSNVGSPEYNMQLSQKRAEAVMSLLAEEFRIAEDRLTITNNGLDDPLAENLKKINRRVDLIIK